MFYIKVCQPNWSGYILSGMIFSILYLVLYWHWHCARRTPLRLAESHLRNSLEPIPNKLGGWLNRNDPTVTNRTRFNRSLKRFNDSETRQIDIEIDGTNREKNLNPRLYSQSTGKTDIFIEFGRFTNQCRLISFRKFTRANVPLKCPLSYISSHHHDLL